MQRKLSDEERSVLGHLVELCCEAYWQEAELCQIRFDSGELQFSARIDSRWNLLEREELSAEDYTEIVNILERLFDCDNSSVKSRLCTVTLDTEMGRPMMNLWFDFEKGSEEPTKHIIRLHIEDLLERRNEPTRQALEAMAGQSLDSSFIN